MTLSRERGYIYFECDEPCGCPEVLETHCQEFDNALKEFKKSDWEMRKTNKGWLHFCETHGEDLNWIDE